MRVGLLTDIHGEKERLIAVLSELRRRGITQQLTFCLGDIVLENDPISNEVINTVRQECIMSLLGNHDALALRIDAPYLTSDSKEYLRHCRNDFIIGNTYFIHDNPLERARKGKGMWNRSDKITEHHHATAVLEDTQNLAYNIIVGHTHVARVFTQKSMYEMDSGGVMELDKEARHICTIGSVGYSRDRISAPKCAIYDSKAQMIEFITVP